MASEGKSYPSPFSLRLTFEERAKLEQAAAGLPLGAYTFGDDRCASVPRDHMRCHFGRDDVQGCISATSRPGDPFHVEAVLVELDLPHLRTDAFARTQHDRGHMAPNNAFSWHLCGAYKTFTMANMAAQRDHLNRVTWERLEAQVLYWGVELGPIHVVTGAIWTRFPEEEFEIFQLDQVDRELMAQPDEPLRSGWEIMRPTGFFTAISKVIYRAGAELLIVHRHGGGGGRGERARLRLQRPAQAWWPAAVLAGAAPAEWMVGASPGGGVR